MMSRRAPYGFAAWNDLHLSTFSPGEEVIVTELVVGPVVWATVDAHGTLFVGTEGRPDVDVPDAPDAPDVPDARDDASSSLVAGAVHWKAFRWATNLERFLRAFPGLVAYGIAYGTTPGHDYRRGGKVAFALQDLLAADGQWVSHDKGRHMTAAYEVPWVPVVARCGYKKPYIEGLVVGPSLLVAPSNSKEESVYYREGVIVKTKFERAHPKAGRAALVLPSCG